MVQMKAWGENVRSGARYGCKCNVLCNGEMGRSYIHREPDYDALKYEYLSDRCELEMFYENGLKFTWAKFVRPWLTIFFEMQHT